MIFTYVPYLYRCIIIDDEDDVGTPVHCNRNSPMSEVYKAYAREKGVEESSLRFCIESKSVYSLNDTPNSLQLEDSCQIMAKTKRGSIT